MTDSPLRTLLRDPVIWICATVLAITAMGVYAFLVSSNHSQDAARFAMLIGQGVMGLTTIIGIATKVVKELQPINEAVTNGVDTSSNGAPPPSDNSG